MQIAMIGTGYVGLTVGTCLAESGNDVICVDKNEQKVETLKEGEIPIYEPGLEELVKRNLEEKRLEFSTDLENAVNQSLLNYITVGTPPQEDGSVDLSAVWQAARSIGKAIDDYKIVVDKSTVPVGTADRVHSIISEETEEDFDVVSNPEFLKEGNAVEDFMKPDRIVIGTDDPRVAEIMKELYSPYVRTENPIIVMDVKSAEMTKYAANSMLATKISLMNEFANLCDQVGADVENVRKGIGADTRIGYDFIFPGVGYGGSCFPKDVKALINTAKNNNHNMQILKAVDQVNEEQKKVLYEKIWDHFQGDLSDKNIAIWGLSFKPGTDDMRGAPSKTIVKNLLNEDATIDAHDPKANGKAQEVFEGNINYHKTPYDALDEADGLALITEWQQFRNPDFQRVKEKMSSDPAIFDGRNIYNPDRLRKMGFDYYGIGRS